jgi:hypothetical protein
MTNTSTKKIVAGLLSLAMVLTLVVGLTVSSVSAQSSSVYTRNLTVGSRGADVTALQGVLNAGGFLSVAPTGYFGSLTKAALAAWQASVGISPASGYFGPITRAYLATNGTGTGSNGCPAGAMYNPTTGQPCSTGTSTVPGCTAGALFSSTTGQSCSGTPSTGGSLDNTDGSATVSLSSYAGDTTIKKGETKDMVAVKLQATAGKVAVTRFDVRMNNRPWLYFSTLTLKDSDGTVIATKNLSSASDATEITVGSDYLVRFEGLNYVVTPGADKTLVVSGTAMANTDKITAGAPVIVVSVPTGAIRTINGKGFTDSLGLGTVATAGTSGRTVTLTSAGTTANILGRVSTSDQSQRFVTTSTSGQTNGVELAAFDFKSENSDSTLNTLIFTLSSNGNSQTEWSHALKNLRLTDGSTSYNVNSVATTSTFANLNIKLQKDSWKTLKLVADIADQDEFTSGSVLIASTTINATNVVGVDGSYTTVTASGSNVVNASQVTFLAAGVSISNLSASVGTAITNNNTTVGYNATYKFTLTNNGSSDIYVAKAPGVMLATSSAASTGGSTASSTISSVAADIDTRSGDTTLAYVIPSNTSRTFTFTGRLSPVAGGAAQNAELKITGIYFGTDATSVATLQANSITFGLGTLKLNTNF